MSDVATPLRDELEHWNEVTSLRYVQCLESVTALAFEDADRHLGLFSTLLEASMQFINQQLDAIHQQSDSDKDEAEGIRMIRADHMILGRTSKMAQQALQELINMDDDSVLRSEMVSRLDIFVRLNNILRQHQLRQHDSLFPLFAEKLAPEDEKQLASKLTSAMQGSNLH